MSKIMINRWKDSANESFAQNGMMINPNAPTISFEITVGQKEYLENHISEVNEWCDDKFGVTPHEVKFEPFWNGMEDVYTCDCYLV